MSVKFGKLILRNDRQRKGLTLVTVATSIMLHDYQPNKQTNSVSLETVHFLITNSYKAKLANIDGISA